MVKPRSEGGELHKTSIKNTIKKYQDMGWKVVDMKGKIPDLVAMKDGKLVCIEVLGRQQTIRGLKHNWTYRQKMRSYLELGFDDVLIETFDYEYGKPKTLSETEVKGCYNP